MPLTHPHSLARATGKEKKKVTKQTQQAQAAADAASEVSTAAIKDALLKIREEEIPPTPDEKEGYFMMQVQIGDQLVQKGVWPLVSMASSSLTWRCQVRPSISPPLARSSEHCASTPPP